MNGSRVFGDFVVGGKSCVGVSGEASDIRCVYMKKIWSVR